MPTTGLLLVSLVGCSIGYFLGSPVVWCFAYSFAQQVERIDLSDSIGADNMLNVITCGFII